MDTAVVISGRHVGTVNSCHMALGLIERGEKRKQFEEMHSLHPQADSEPNEVTCTCHWMIESALSEERDRIAGEIHDNLIQSFLSVISILRSAPNSPHVDAALAQARSGIQAARNCARALRGLNFRASNLPKVASQMAARVLPPGVRLQTELAAPWPVLPSEVGQALYRCIQEAVNNAVKHSSCTNLTLRFHAAEEGAKVEVIDDGVGFHVRSCLQEGGLGLYVMRDRITAVGGKVKFLSSPRGTRVTFFVDSTKTLRPRVEGTTEHGYQVAL